MSVPMLGDAGSAVCHRVFASSRSIRHQGKGAQ
jgi:hypothetical protein